MASSRAYEIAPEVCHALHCRQGVRLKGEDSHPPKEEKEESLRLQGKQQHSAATPPRSHLDKAAVCP
jgi:hypothetical protein